METGAGPDNELGPQGMAVGEPHPGPHDSQQHVAVTGAGPANEPGQDKPHEPEVNTAKIYVDDNRAAAECLAPGTTYNPTRQVIEWVEPEEDEDCVMNIQQQVLNVLKSLVKGLSFTQEDFTDFEDGKLPTLDFALEIGEGGRLQ